MMTQKQMLKEAKKALKELKSYYSFPSLDEFINTNATNIESYRWIDKDSEIFEIVLNENNLKNLADSLGLSLPRNAGSNYEAWARVCKRNAFALIEQALNADIEAVQYTGCDHGLYGVHFYFEVDATGLLY